MWLRNRWQTQSFSDEVPVMDMERRAGHVMVFKAIYNPPAGGDDLLF